MVDPRSASDLTSCGSQIDDAHRFAQQVASSFSMIMTIIGLPQDKAKWKDGLTAIELHFFEDRARQRDECSEHRILYTLLAHLSLFFFFFSLVKGPRAL